MNILFLTACDVHSFDQHDIYCDLLRKFKNNGHEVYCISSVEKRYGVETHWEENKHILRLKVGNTVKTNILEKGISTVLMEPQFKAAIKKYFSHIKFDLVLYATPPITLLGAIKYVKKRDNAKTYLMLKDIFPQNAVDIGMLSTSGAKGFIYRYFRRKEKKFYAVSDKIGCMSPANVQYVIDNNPEVNPDKVEVCPNAIEILNTSITDSEKQDIKEKYGIPSDKRVFIYGGNLGKPQGISFVVDCLRAVKDVEDAFFIIIGSGTEFGLLEDFVNSEQPKNIKLMKTLPKEDYDKMVMACDVGLLFLDHRFTIPNFPCRLLSYMQAGLPVLACTDPNTDVGKIITDGGFGWWCESNDVSQFLKCVEEICHSDLAFSKEKELQFLKDNYSVDVDYKRIMDAMI